MSQREYKFRQWYGSVSGMRYFTGDTWADAGQGIAKDIGESEVMQFTGLRDMHGREIFDGDIVQTYTPSLTSRNGLSKLNTRVIRWRETAVHVGWNIGRGRTANQGENLKYTEVIGDIYRTPELVP